MAFEIKNLTVGYKGVAPLVENVGLIVPDGELVAIMGRNGVGKSTLLRSLAGVVRPLAGDVALDGSSLFSMSARELARNVAFVSTEIVSVAHLRVWDVVSTGRAPYTGWMGTLSAEDISKVSAALEQVGMLGFADVPLDRLSDGERQRVMIARALAQDTKLILLDEPTAFLDLPNRYQITILLRELAHRGGKTVIFSTHDLETAMRLSDTVWIMSDRVIATGAPEDLIAAGRFGAIFRDTDLSLGDAGEICLKSAPAKFVRVVCATPLLLKALERCEVGVDPAAARSVEALPGGGYALDGSPVSDIYELSRLIKEL